MSFCFALKLLQKWLQQLSSNLQASQNLAVNEGQGQLQSQGHILTLSQEWLQQPPSNLEGWSSIMRLNIQ